jgi:hypothetical protein
MRFAMRGVIKYAATNRGTKNIGEKMKFPMPNEKTISTTINTPTTRTLAKNA